MMNRRIAFWSTLILGSVGAATHLGVLPALAAPVESPFELVPFRGQIEKNGAPYTDKVTLTFKIFNGIGEAAPLCFVETIADVQPIDGSFSVILGRDGRDGGGAAIRLGQVLRNCPDAHVGVAVGGVDLAERRRLLAAPFASRVEGLRSPDILDGQIETRHLSVRDLTVGSGGSASRGEGVLEVAGAAAEIALHSQTSWIEPSGRRFAWHLRGGKLRLRNAEGTELLEVSTGLWFNDPALIKLNGATRMNGLYFPAGKAVSEADNPTNVISFGHGTQSHYFHYKFGTLNFVQQPTSPVMIPTPPQINVVNGCLRANGADLGNCSSDARLKKNIRSIGSALDDLARLRPVRFEWRRDEFPWVSHEDERGESYGLIAQDVERVRPDLVSEGSHGFKSVNYAPLPMLVIQAVRELKERDDAKSARIAELERRLAKLEGLCAAR